MITLLLIWLAWFVLALGVGVVIGLSIREADRRQQQQPGRPWVAREGYATDEELWEAQMRHPSGRDSAA